MKNREVSSKALSAWVAAAMFGPVALVSAGSAWSAVLVTAIVCSSLCLVAFRFGGDFACRSRIINVLFMLWNVYAVAAVAALACQCWPGKGSQIATALVLIALGAVSAYQSERSAAAVAATLCPLCAVIFAIVLSCGIGNVRWSRVEVSAIPPRGMLIFVFLLPIAAMAIRRSAEPSTGALVLSSSFGVILSVIVMGTVSLPVMLTQDNAFFEFSKSLDLFGAVQRFESIAAVAVTMSIFTAISLLLSGVGSIAQGLCRGSGRWAVLLSALVSAAVVVFQLWLSPKAVAIVSIFIWGFLGAAGRFFPAKKVEKT